MWWGAPCILLGLQQAAPELLHCALFYIDPDTGKTKPTEVHNKNVSKNPARPGTAETGVHLISFSE